MKIRTITIDDYPTLILFWKENYFVSDMDSIDRFKVFLEKNPDLSILAEENGKIIGTALGSFDGRRGYLQKLVVQKSQRKHGVGQQLVHNICEKLQKLGVLYLPIAVEKHLVHFYQNCGFHTTTQTSMNIEFKAI